uniref:V3 n=1 Tax=Opuntia virus 2-DBG_56 TaxID=3033938 RepID=A0A8A9WQ90_9GEMI|nr:V3 [Opuntia virus 2-DBG_56]QTT61687.1 V3 [Opuntia virus 2-DBG_56]QTT61697.1 V3 [Opuntia virus 2-DBG_56]QTT61817.1 V3 [Opuntia virus 2-DBG_56]QTT61867.1 V3 [Opuntia virus 2-DBG_56]
MMVCIPDWLFLLFIFSVLLDSTIIFYGTFQSGSISQKLSILSSRVDELFLAVQQVVHSRCATRDRTTDFRRRRSLSAIPEGSEEIAEAQV